MPRQKTPKPRSRATKKKPKSLKAIYARLKRGFTAADLQKYTVIEPMVPAEQVLAKMRDMYRQHLLKKKATNGRKR